MIKLIVGLGNPGAEYEATRHNAGFWLVDQLARMGGATPRVEGRFHGLAARARLENWLYWIVINGVMVFLFYAQEVWGMAVLSVLLMGVAVSGFIAWRRRFRAQGAQAVAA